MSDAHAVKTTLMMMLMGYPKVDESSELRSDSFDDVSHGQGDPDAIVVCYHDEEYEIVVRKIS